ncbi:glycosyl transferase family group 2-domain-containing protein [Xylariomycetidae sp. FL0641]|nr:glycosyl transferase family group 2-domain-containing protein [Xylariomycetidae sp. FL0641]
MGLKSYFRPDKGKQTEKAGAVNPVNPPELVNEKSEVARGKEPGPLLPMVGPPSGATNTPGLSRNASSVLLRINDSEEGGAKNINDIKAEVICSWLWQQQISKQYTSGGMLGEGVVLKKRKGEYACFPQSLKDIEDGLYDNIQKLNVRCAMTVNTRVINVILAATADSMNYIPISPGLRLQVLPSLGGLPECQKNHFAAFIRDHKLLVVWDDDAKKCLARAEHLETELMKMIWGAKDPAEIIDEKGEKQHGIEVDIAPVELGDAEDKTTRRVSLTVPVTVSLTLVLAIAAMGTGVRALAYEIAIDGDFKRLALLVVCPIQLWVGFFFFQIIIGNLLEVFGPISSIHRNNKHYSGAPPKRLHRDRHRMPHVTIQMPVYKEGLEAVIIPTVQSLKACMSTYEMQGGTANIFVNDDGYQLIDEHERAERKEFYEENNIGWVSRPKHNPKPEDGSRPFQRRGKFKKASNMNYGLMISNRVEDKMLQIERAPMWNQYDEAAAYQTCLEEVLAEDEGRTVADGNIRVGDYILIIDSDTRVPEDCLLDAVSEMEQSPQVAILQYSSGVMQVSNSFFERGVTWFTNLIYTAITFVVANGDSCPFVGHNAILRWSAIQDAASYQDEDGYEKFWSEAHVSEDFDMSLRVQCAGYHVRFASYTGEGFKEGVSLTVYDELARWEKYAYGCNELMFHPLKYWLTRGPITPLFRKFVFSSIPLAMKMTICSYIGTYYAVAAAWLLTLFNYFLTGWFYGLYDKFFLDSFAIFISVIVVFTGWGNVALAILRYRLNEKSFFGAFWENIKWVPLMAIFLGGLSIHVSQAILSHFFSIDMSWGATAKEVEEVNFLEEVPRLLRRFKGTFLFVLAILALIICGFYAFPYQWRITYFASIWPLGWLAICHFLLPVALNPALMVFAW